MSFSCTRRVPFVYPEQKRNPKTLENKGFSGKRRLLPLRFEYLLTHKNECRR